MRFAEMGKEELQSLYDSLMTEYEAYKQQGLQLNMSRGKPAPEQLDLCAEVNACPADFICEDGTDVRNYGALDGIPDVCLAKFSVCLPAMSLWAVVLALI